MVLMIDNYDSFTFNLVQYLGELGAEMKVFRNDEVSVPAIEALAPSHIVISPGPGRPADAGVSCEVVRRCTGTIPILGVCLGHQCIGEVFGGKVVRAERLVLGSDCGMGREGMSRRHAFHKMVSIVQGTNIVRRELGLPEAPCLAADERYSMVEDR